MATPYNSSNYQGFEEPENKHTNGLPQSKRRLSFSRQRSADKLVIVLVGLPARGKSYIAKKIQIYLSWRGHQCRVFNVGQERRRRASHLKYVHNTKSQHVSPSYVQKHDSHFFRADNTEAAKLRTEVAMHVLEGVLEWIKDGGQVGIFDATNTTQARRRLLVERCTQAGVRLLFIESICNDPKIIDENLKMKISRSPDYANTPPEIALGDIKQRIKNYEAIYETLDDEEGLSYIKIINMSSKLEACNVTGVIPRLLIIFVMNLHADQKRKIWICRAGNTTHDPVGHGSAVPYKTEHCALSPQGIKFSQNLAAFIKAQNIEGEYQVWTSTLNRAVETIRFISKPGLLSSYGALKMVHQGVCYGMSPRRIKNKFPDLYENWQADPFRYRFSGGESYMDVVQRLEPLVVDIEQLSCPILIVTHLSCLRILYSYFKGTPVEECPSLEFPQGSVIQFSPSLYGWQESMFNLMDDNFIDNLLDDSTDSS